MIEAFRRIGEIKREELDKDNFKEEFLQELSNPIKTHYGKWSKKDKENNLISLKRIIINLNSGKKEIEVICDEDISNEKQLVFSKPGNIARIDFNANALKYHLEKTIPDLINFIEKEVPNPEKYNEFIDYLKKYKKIFYIKKGKEDFLNFNLIKDKQDCKSFEELILKKLDIIKGDFKNYNSFFLNLDRENILNSKFKEDFLEIKYFQLIGRFFELGGKNKGIKEEKYFHLGKDKDKITNNIDILTKFYMTEKNIFFENFEKKNAYKSFSVNKKAYEELLLGINEIWNNLNFYLNGLSYLLVPKSNDFIRDLKGNIIIIKDEMGDIQNSKEAYKTLEAISEEKNWSFDLIFYEKKNNYFNVFKVINDLSYFNLEEISKKISIINETDKDIRNTFNREYKNYRFFDLNQFWKSLYEWTNLTNFKDKRILYRTEFLDYLDCIYDRRKIKQEKLIKKFLFNLKRHFYKQRNLNPLILNSFNSLIFLLRLGLIENKKMEKEKTILSKELSNEDIKSFFEIYPEVFGNDLENGQEKQGLILLGYLVNQVIFSQGNKSKNFINKINFDGIKKEKLRPFITEVIEFLNIYSKRDKPLIKWNNQIIFEMEERLINIKKSTLIREEITYYILLGTFLGTYIGIRRGAQKKAKVI